ncbi:hypothetical protein BASA81_004947 [Batrachochytrium salamandrivorans]|nr:hypothetical protein BASA81_004947 [Batrachochytrium salamandrivorans]
MLSKAELTSHVGKVMPPESWGHPGWLSPSELVGLETLRDRCQREMLFPGQMMEDRGLLRFLRARKFDDKESFKMLQLDLEWRKVFEHRPVKSSEVPAVVDFCRNGFLFRSGVDKDNRPIITLKFRHAFPRNIKDMNEIVLFWLAYVQRLTEECERNGTTDFSVICDLEGFSPSVNFSMAMVKVLINILQNHYPERLGFLLLLNLPAAFRMGWGLLQPFLDERTKAKIHVLGRDITRLQEYIPESELEQEYGGKHVPYAKMDLYVMELLERGIVIHTGYFGIPPPSPSSSSPPQHSNLDRLRNLVVTPRTVQKLGEVPKQNPRVAIFGSNGRTGLEVIQRFLQTTSYDVVAFVRLNGGSGVPPRMLKLVMDYSPRLSLVVGDCLNYNDVDRAVEMSDAVVSCIGGARGNGDNDFYEKTARAIVDSMQRNGSKRLVVVTAAQAKRMSMAWWDKNATVGENSLRHLYWGGHFKYVAEMEKYIKHESELDYTFLRPSQLDDIGGGLDYSSQPDEFFLPGSALPRPALAKCIVDECVLGERYIGVGVAVAGSKME